MVQKNEVAKGLTSLVNDINSAGEAIAAARQELVTVQAAAAQGIFAPLPSQDNEIHRLLDSITMAGTRVQDFMTDVGNPNDPGISYNSASGTAQQITALLNLVKSVASHTTNPQVQQNLLKGMYDILERVFLLLGTSRDMVTNVPTQESRRKVMALAYSLSQGFTALRSALPGVKDIDMAVSTINSAVSELSYNLPTGVGEFLRCHLRSANPFSNVSLCPQILTPSSSPWTNLTPLPASSPLSSRRSAPHPPVPPRR